MKIDAPLTTRLAVRILVMDADERLLLLRAVVPDDGRVFWLAPGGGLEAGESYEAAAVRELREETGLVTELGPCVWTRRHRHTWNGRINEQYERFFVVRTMFAEIRPALPDGYITGHRWWTLAEIATSTENFAPRRLAELLPALLRRDFPAEPIDCGV